MKIDHCVANTRVGLLQGEHILQDIQCLTFLLSLHPGPTTTAESHLPRHCPVGGTDGRFQADIARGNHMLHKALSHVCVSEGPWVYCLTTDALRGKSFSLCGIGGLSLPLGSQYNYQRLQAAPLPGIEWLSQGYYYFHAELFGSQTQHLNNLVYEAYDSKKKRKRIKAQFLLRIRSSGLAADSVLSVSF